VKSPFDQTVDGVNLHARFQTSDEAIKNFRNFKDLNIAPYNYCVEKGRVNLWVLTGIK
jgi:hypothetical protein